MVQERERRKIGGALPATPRHPDSVRDRNAGSDKPEKGADARVLREADTKSEEEDDGSHREDEQVERHPHQLHAGASSALMAIVSGQLTPAETMYCMAWAELQSVTSMSSRGSWTSQPDWGMGVEGI